MNKKLIKTIASVTCGLGIVSSIPFMTTSCGSSNPTPDPQPQPTYKPLPLEVYDISGSGVAISLNGFTHEFLSNPNKYSECDTIEVPAQIAEVASYAFSVSSSVLFSTIPSYIKHISFEHGIVDLVSIESCSFVKATSIVSLELPMQPDLIGSLIFNGCTNLSEIIWNDIEDVSYLTLSNDSFAGVASTGIIKVKGGSVSSSELLQRLQQDAGLPSGWTAE